MKHNVRDSKGRFCKKVVEPVTKGYKGFNKGLICRDKQYKVGETYEEDGYSTCEKGMMHFCESPLDVLYYYPVFDPDTGEPNEFAKVEAIGSVVKGNHKSATNRLRIIRKLSLEELIKVAATIGNCSDAVTAKYSSNAVTKGNHKHAATAGKFSDAVIAGEQSKAITAGQDSSAITVEAFSPAVTVGSCSDAVTTGRYSNAITVGCNSPAIASGENSIAAALGIASKAKAALGNLIVLAEYAKESKPLHVKSAKVDGKKIKANTFYKLKNGEFVEA